MEPCLATPSGGTGLYNCTPRRARLPVGASPPQARQGNCQGDGRRGERALLCAGAGPGKRAFDCPVLTVSCSVDALDVEYRGEACVRGIDGKGAVKQHPMALEERRYDNCRP